MRRFRMRAGLLCLVTISLTLAGCTHEANIGVRVQNQTDAEALVHVAFIKEQNAEEVWEKTLLVPARNPPTEKHLAQASFPAGNHILRVSSGNLTAELRWDFGASTKGLEITITDSEILLSLTEV